MTDDASGRLAWLEGEVARHASVIVGGAGQCPPGGNRSWDELLGLYRVAPLSPVDRVSEVVGRRMTRGAVPTEVRLALASVARWAQGELAGLATLGSDPRFSLVQRQIAHLEVQADQYESSVAPSLAPSVGSIFANASATAGKAPWNQVKVSPTTVFVCATCGAPQQTPLEFTCKYCGNSMTGRA